MKTSLYSHNIITLTKIKLKNSYHFFQDYQDDKNEDILPAQHKRQHSDDSFTITPIMEVINRKFGVEERTFRVQFHPEQAGDRLIDIKEDLQRMFDATLQTVDDHFSAHDRIRLNISHSNLSSDVTIHLQQRQNITAQSIMDRMDKVLNSNEDIQADQTFKIDVGIMKLHRGGGKGRVPFNNLNRDTRFAATVRKRAFVNVPRSEDNMCAARALIICQAKLDGWKKSDFDNLVRKDRFHFTSSKSLYGRAVSLQLKTPLPIGHAVAINELHYFEPVLNIKIVVVQVESGKPSLIPCSKFAKDSIAFLYYENGHYFPVVNPASLFHDSEICIKCLKIYKRQKRPHVCEDCCYICLRDSCTQKKWIKCSECNVTCKNQECFDSHKSALGKNLISRCDRIWQCDICRKQVVRSERDPALHQCGEYKCVFCNNYVLQGHLCYHRARKPLQNSGKFIFFDCETRQDSKIDCNKGYCPSKPNGCGAGCFENSLCSSCNLCKNCNDCVCGRNYHIPNLVVCHNVCDMCHKDGDILDENSSCPNCVPQCPPGDDDSIEHICNASHFCGKRELIFKGDHCVDRFCNWLFSPVNKGKTVLAHNASGFDLIFILNFLLRIAKIRPSLIYRGSKIITMTVGHGLNMKFIDSLNFIGMALKKFPKALELEVFSNDKMINLTKGDFPHRMNTEEYQSYDGDFPSLEMYDIDSMPVSEREQFIEWHIQQRGKQFNLQQEMLQYCKMDVIILRLGCMKFRKLMIDVTSLYDSKGSLISSIDPFSYVTIASACMNIYRVNFMKEYHNITLSNGQSGIGILQRGRWSVNDVVIHPCDITEKEFVSSDLPQIPQRGYRKSDTYSLKAIQWLEWKALKLGRQIIHAHNQGEHRVGQGYRYLLDGYDPVNHTAYEYYGCYFHGHSCITDRNLREPRTGFSMNDLHRQTQVKESVLRELKYKVVSIYECQFDAMIKANPELSNFVTQLDIPPRMKIRDAFYGGRTEAFKLHYKCTENEEIHYLDICSLYPFINKTAKLPMGHPDIITSDFDYSFQSYFGIAHVKILPVRGEYVPCLPSRINGRLKFVSCRKCAERELTSACKHTENERALVGVWCTPEIMEALHRGYKLLKIYECYSYSESSQYDPNQKSGGLFSEQVNLFMKIKTEASGYPPWVENNLQKASYIADTFEKEGIKLDPDKIMHNPSLRSLAKICLNSFWGKLGERSNKTQTSILSSYSELVELANDRSNELVDFHIINDDVITVDYRKTGGFEPESHITNEVMAAFTTCYARLELLKYLDFLGRQILYCDTDSVIFVTKHTPDNSVGYSNYPNLGWRLGELTNELPSGVYIEEFISTGPKSYAYRLNTGQEVCKFKGITLNYRNSRKITFTAAKELLLNETKTKITLDPSIQFRRLKHYSIIYNILLSKKVQVTFNKRLITDTLDTLPFGF